MKRIRIILVAITAAGLMVSNGFAAGSGTSDSGSGSVESSAGMNTGTNLGTSENSNSGTQAQEEYGASPTFGEERQGLYNRNRIGEEGITQDDLQRDDQGVLQEQEEFGASPQFDYTMDEEVGEQNEYGVSPGFDQGTQGDTGVGQEPGPYDQPLTGQEPMKQRGMNEDQEEFGVSPGFDQNRSFPAERDTENLNQNRNTLEEPGSQRSFPQERTIER